MKVELTNKHLDAYNTMLLKATSRVGELHLIRLLLPPSHYQEGEQRKAFYSINSFDARGRIVCGDEEDRICGFDYRRVKREFLRLAKDNSYVESLTKKAEKRRQRK